MKYPLKGMDADWNPQAEDRDRMTIENYRRDNQVQNIIYITVKAACNDCQYNLVPTENI